MHECQSHALTAPSDSAIIERVRVRHLRAWRSKKEESSHASNHSCFAYRTPGPPAAHPEVPVSCRPPQARHLDFRRTCPGRRLFLGCFRVLLSYHHHRAEAGRGGWPGPTAQRHGSARGLPGAGVDQLRHALAGPAERRPQSHHGPALCPRPRGRRRAHRLGRAALVARPVRVEGEHACTRAARPERRRAADGRRARRRHERLGYGGPDAGPDPRRKSMPRTARAPTRAPTTSY